MGVEVEGTAEATEIEKEVHPRERREADRETRKGHQIARKAEVAPRIVREVDRRIARRVDPKIAKRVDPKTEKRVDPRTVRKARRRIEKRADLRIERGAGLNRKTKSDQDPRNQRKRKQKRDLS